MMINTVLAALLFSNSFVNVNHLTSRFSSRINSVRITEYVRRLNFIKAYEILFYASCSTKKKRAST